MEKRAEARFGHVVRATEDVFAAAAGEERRTFACLAFGTRAVRFEDEAPVEQFWSGQVWTETRQRVRCW